MIIKELICRQEYSNTYLALIIGDAGTIGIDRVEKGNEVDENGNIRLKLFFEDDTNLFVSGFLLGLYMNAAIGLPIPAFFATGIVSAKDIDAIEEVDPLVNS